MGVAADAQVAEWTQAQAIPVEILVGLAPSDRVVDSPQDSLAAGDLIQVAAEPGEAGKQTRPRPESNKQ
jgi:hypothetical protein